MEPPTNPGRFIPPDGGLQGSCGGDGPDREGFAVSRAAWTEEHQGCVAESIRSNSPHYRVAEPREQSGSVRVAVLGAGARQDSGRVQGTPGRCVRFRLTLDAVDL